MRKLDYLPPLLGLVSLCVGIAGQAIPAGVFGLCAGLISLIDSKGADDDD